METTVTRRERKKLETRQRLLDSAESLFHEQGYRSTTVEEITERADVAKGTFFNYFPSKDALLAELSLWGTSKLSRIMDPDQGAPTSPLARIRLLFAHLHEKAGRNPRLTHHMFAARLCGSPPPSYQVRHRLTDLLASLVSEAQDKNEMRRDLEPELIGSLLQLSYFHQVLRPLHHGENIPPLDSFERIIDLWMEGLAGPNWSKE